VFQDNVVSVGDIDPASVRVHTPKDELGAQLSFLFRDNDAQQARRTFFTTTLSGIVEHEAERKKRGGLILSFDTVEANRVAAAPRPSLEEGAMQQDTRPKLVAEHLASPFS
jgi:hypothetical protein